MGIRKRLWKWCPKPEKPILTKLKRHSTAIYILLTATVLIVSFSLFSSTFLVRQPQVIVPAPPPAAQPSEQHSPGTIYINADGSIDPSTAPIQRVGDVYTFTSDISGSISVERDNITIDGAGYAFGGIKRTKNYGNQISVTIYGISLIQRSNITIRNATGHITLVNSSNCIIYGNKCSIRMDYSFNNSIVGNNMTTSSYGIFLTHSYNNSIYGNYITNNENGISLLSSENNTIYENAIANNMYDGLGLWEGSIHNTIIRNNFINNTQQAGGGDSIPNIWDDGTTGNYWSDLINGSTYAIKIFIMKDGITKLDYDNHPQLQPFTIPAYPIPEPLFLFPTSSPSPSPSLKPTLSLSTEAIIAIIATIVMVIAVTAVALRKRHS